MNASEHPSDEQLWLDDPSVRRHVEACPACRGARAAARRRQEAVAAALAAATPATMSMPQTVQHRLAAALQDEARSGTDDSDGQDTAVRTGRRHLAAGLAAAALVLVLVGTVLGVRGSSDPVAGGSSEDDLVESAETAQQPSDNALSEGAEDDGTTGLPPVPPALVEEAERDDADRAGRVQDDCGSGVLDDTGDIVLAVAEVTTDPRGGVLVTVEGDDGVVLWWLPSCEAGVDEAYGRSAAR